MKSILKHHSVFQGNLYFIFISLIVISCGGSSSTDISSDLNLTPSTSSSFLTEEYLYDFEPGINAGFGQNQFPEVILEEPQSTSLDVLSFGSGGVLTIELSGEKLINGEGIDFIIFENPFSNFAERAQVSVSLDGEEFFNFNCEVDDQENNYPGCAGVNPINFDSDFTSIDNMGGDQFDLDDLGLDEIRFIRIADLETCEEGDITYPVCASPGKQGFDLDGIYLNYLTNI